MANKNTTEYLIMTVYKGNFFSQQRIQVDCQANIKLPDCMSKKIQPPTLLH